MITDRELQQINTIANSLTEQAKRKTRALGEHARNHLYAQVSGRLRGVVTRHGLGDVHVAHGDQSSTCVDS